ncbi:hypothetical protein PV10_04429 [Exophiala mesophila]|uniref:RING-type domain-containing protein n=1 Tax=Exophiala mesophila TaxID=212818 RepID=A0A0D1ZEN8_EXOME|nr:uncharacterized protein PV10_04429 [Exophiala mesophila]KIV93192.1 hypothetical protein PV10_04429 [Exophiala mesophila]
MSSLDLSETELSPLSPLPTDVQPNKQNAATKDLIAMPCLICLEDMVAPISDKIDDAFHVFHQDETIACPVCDQITHIDCLTNWFDKPLTEDLCPHCRKEVSDEFLLKIFTLVRGQEAATKILQRKKQDREEVAELQSSFPDHWRFLVFHTRQGINVYPPTDHFMDEDQGWSDQGENSIYSDIPSTWGEERDPPDWGIHEEDDTPQFERERGPGYW